MRTHTMAALGASIILVGVAAPAGAATFDVDKLTDDAGGGACTAAPGDCSLRSAYVKANVAGDADTISLGPGTHLLASSLTINKYNLTLAGSNARSTVIEAGNVANGFTNDSALNPDLTVRDLTLRGVKAGASSAAIDTAGGSLVLQRSAVVDNAVAGVRAGGESVIENSLVARNTGSGSAGVTGRDLLVVRNSTITQNIASGGFAFGAGLVGGCLTVVQNSTFADNFIDPSSATFGGNNLTTLPPASLGSCSAATLRVSNSIVAGGGAGGDCGGDITSVGGNLDTDGTCGFTLPGDRRAATAGLAALADNGGPTNTRALLASSGALELGDDCLAADQRGIARPQGGRCDAGAFESALAAPAPVVTGAPGPPPPVAPAPATTIATTTTVTVPAPADTRPAKVSLTGLRKVVTRAALRKGLRLTVAGDEAVSIEATLSVAPRRVTIARTYDLTLASATLRRGAGRRVLTLKPRKAIAGKRAVAAQLRVAAVDAGGNRTVVTRAFTIR